MTDHILARSFPVVFEDAGGGKLLARLPAGELAWSEQLGLYEWRRAGSGSDVYGQRIDYAGGDRQSSATGLFWTRGLNRPVPGIPPPVLGFHAAQDPVRMN